MPRNLGRTGAEVDQHKDGPGGQPVNEGEREVLGTGPARALELARPATDGGHVGGSGGIGGGIGGEGFHQSVLRVRVHNVRLSPVIGPWSGGSSRYGSWCWVVGKIGRATRDEVSAEIPTNRDSTGMLRRAAVSLSPWPMATARSRLPVSASRLDTIPLHVKPLTVRVTVRRTTRGCMWRSCSKAV
jgi:hypothetical protein